MHRPDHGLTRPATTQDIKRRYPLVLDVGSGPGFLAKHLDPEITQKVVMVDPASASLALSIPLDRAMLTGGLLRTEDMLYRDADVETEGEPLLAPCPSRRQRAVSAAIPT